MLKTFFRIVFIFSISIMIFTACDLFDTLPNSDTSPNDLDGDGISNQDELDLYNTNPYSDDSDGDGFTDYEEVFSLSFDPQSDVARFNPLIADMPTYEIHITSEPDIYMNMSVSGGSTTSRSITEGSAVSNGFTTSSTNEFSTSAESSWGISAGVVTKIGTQTGCEVQANAEFSHGWSSTQTLSYSQERSQELSSSIDSTKEYAVSEGYEMSGGAIALTVNVVNTGHVAFTVENMSLSALLFSPFDPDTFSPVSTLEPQTSFVSFPDQTLAPGNTWESLVFTAEELTVQQTEDLIFNPSGLGFRVCNFEITDVSHLSIAHNQTAIQANTAVIMIDYGDVDIPVEKYRVCTTARRDDNGNLLGISLGEVFRDILLIPYETVGVYIQTPDGTKRSTTIRSIRELENDFDQNKGWVINSTIDELQGYEYHFDHIELRAGDVVNIVYIKDDDNDTIGYREERFYGSSDQELDTDQDGISDYDEIRNGWTVLGESVISCPYLTDTDFDGLSDVEEETLGTHPSRRDTDQDGFSDYLENEVQTDPLSVTNALLKNLVLSDGLILGPAFSSGVFDYSSSSLNLSSFSIQPQIDAAGSTVSINGSPVTPDVFSDNYSLALGANEYNIIVTSDGELATRTYNLTVTNTTESLVLSTLQITDLLNNSLPISPLFSPETNDYSCELVAETIRITAAAGNPLEEISLTQTIGLVEDVVPLTDSYFQVDLPIGESSVSITLDSAESENTNTYNLNFLNVLGAPSDLTLSNEWYTKISGNFTSSNDPRVSGYLVLRSTNETPFENPADTVYSAGDIVSGNYTVVDSTNNGFTDSGLDDDTLYYYTVYAHYQDDSHNYYSGDYLFVNAATQDWVPPEPVLNLEISNIEIKNVEDTYTEDPDFKLALGFIRPDGAEVFWVVDSPWGDFDIGDNITKSHYFGTSGNFSVTEEQSVDMRWYVEEQDCGVYWDETVTIPYSVMKAVASGGTVSGTAPDRTYTASLETSAVKRMNEERSYKNWIGLTESVEISVWFTFQIEYTETASAPEDGS